MLLRIFHRRDYSDYVRNFIFGVEDSLVSTVGLLSGISAADASRSTILLTGFVLIAVEAFSMGVGSYLSEQSAADFRAKQPSEWRGPALSGLIMLGSYLAAGFIPLSPYLLHDGSNAFWLSIISSLTALVGLGALSAHLLDGSMWRTGLRTLLLGGLAIGIGISVGNFVR